ncbi:MAG: hypothetical protein ABJA61_00885 [Caldimonas sp.]
MVNGPRDLAQIRFDNATRLFDEFASATVKHADAATLRGLEGRFAERLQIQPSYWSQIKARSRQIGERLARQFEQLSRKPAGWMDEPHDEAIPPREATAHAPVDDDERFIVGLVLSYYRRHPERARARLLDLLGEALQPSASAPAQPGVPARRVTAGSDAQLWSQARAAVAPLKRKR